MSCHRLMLEYLLQLRNLLALNLLALVLAVFWDLRTTMNRAIHLHRICFLTLKLPKQHLFRMRTQIWTCSDMNMNRMTMIFVQLK